MSLFNSLFKSSDSSLSSEEINSALDLATYAGSLASNPSDIDLLLDPVRRITATHSLEDGLASADEAVLFRVYLELEAYLMTRDPIRTYSKEELRQRIGPDLLAKLIAQESKRVNT